MLARDLVIKKATQPIVLMPTPGTNGYTVYKDRLYMLYHARLLWKDGVIPGDDIRTLPIVVGFRADEFMLGESNQDKETAFMTWAVGRARGIMDEKVLSQNWRVQLSAAHLNDYFHVRLTGDSQEHLHQNVFGDTTYHWTYFFNPHGHDYRTIKERYRKDTRC